MARRTSEDITALLFPEDGIITHTSHEQVPHTIARNSLYDGQAFRLLTLSLPFIARYRGYNHTFLTATRVRRLGGSVHFMFEKSTSQIYLTQSLILSVVPFLALFKDPASSARP